MSTKRTGWQTAAGAGAKRNRESFVRVGLMVVVALVLAWSVPQGLAVAVFSGLLFIGAAVAAVFAVLMRDDPFAGHFTRWDEAAALLGLSMAAGLLVDPSALDRAVDLQPMGPAIDP